jgi:hypothetical protein
VGCGGKVCGSPWKMPAVPSAVSPATRPNPIRSRAGPPEYCEDAIDESCLAAGLHAAQTEFYRQKMKEP